MKIYVASELDGCAFSLLIIDDCLELPLAGKYEPFDVVTRKSLLHALSDAGSSLSSERVENIMAFYHALPSFEDAAPAWHDLNDVQGLECWIFSNGTHEVRRPEIMSIII
jgi:hypothetical protein